MNKFLIVALFLIISCESTTDSESTINFYKCLLLDSDVTFNYLNDIVKAIKSLDPVKLVNTFSTIYPAILSEVERCKKEANNEIVLNEEETEKNSDSDFLPMILKMLTKYVIPFLKEHGINLGEICKMILPDSPICKILEIL